MQPIKSIAKIYLLFMYSFLFAQNSGDAVFSGIKVHTIKIQFDQTNYWDSLTTYYDQGNEQYIVAKITIDGTNIDSCGVRLKGNSSYSHPNNKKPMKIDFNQYRDNQRYDGLKGLFLNNCYSDPSFIREKIHLDFCRDTGIPAPRANYAMVYINNVVWGLYSIVEPVDKKFLSTHYGNKDGNLYKAVDAFGGGLPGGLGGGQTTSQILSDFVYYGSTSSSYTDHYELKTDDAVNPWTDLISVINTLNNSINISDELPAQVNLTSVYKAIGTDILFANMDSYTESGRNFYVYFNKDTKKMEWIIWDVNMSFGSYPGSASTPETISLTYTSSSSSRPLMSKIFGNSTLKTNYLNTIGEVFNKYFVPSKLNVQTDSIATIIRPYVILDTKKQYTLEQFDVNIASDVIITSSGGQVPGGSRTERKPGIKSFITSRYTNVKTQLANYGITGISQDEMNLETPSEFSLSQNYPNPFNPETTISYKVQEASQVSLIVYDVLGNEVATLVNEYKQAGFYNSQFSIRNSQLPSGVYFYRLQAGNFSSVKKMLLVK